MAKNLPVPRSHILNAARRQLGYKRTRDASMLHLCPTRRVSTLGTACPHPVGVRAQWMAEGCLRQMLVVHTMLSARTIGARQAVSPAGPRTTTPVATALKRVCADTGENGRVPRTGCRSPAIAACVRGTLLGAVAGRDVQASRPSGWSL